MNVSTARLYQRVRERFFGGFDVSQAGIDEFFRGLPAGTHSVYAAALRPVLPRGVRVPPRPPVNVPLLTPEQSVEIERCFVRGDWRARLACWLALYCAARLQDLAGATSGLVHAAGRRVWVWAPTGAVLPEPAVGLMRRHGRLRGGSKPLFPGERGPLSANGLQRAVRRLLAPFGERVSLSTLRNVCIAHEVDARGARAAADMLGVHVDRVAVIVRAMQSPDSGWSSRLEEAQSPMFGGGV